MRQISWLILYVIVTIILNTSAYASDIHYSEDYIRGKIVEFMNDKSHTVARIESNNKTYWLIMTEKTKLITGKIYEFYPAYLIQYNVHDNDTKRKYSTLLHTVGVINKNIDLSKYAFKGIAIGTHFDDVLTTLSKLGYNVINESEDDNQQRVVKIQNFMLGGFATDVYFQDDIHKKLASYRFVIQVPSNDVDIEWIVNRLEFLSGIFTEKYGKPRITQNRNKLRLNADNKIVHSYWRFGDIDIVVDFDDVTKTIRGLISSTTRSLQTYNYYAAQIENNNKRINELEKKITSDVYKEGASSY